MNEFPPNINPRLATLSAFIVGFILIDDFTGDEQRAIGNWAITVGQTLLMNATYQLLIENRIEGNDININSRQAKCGGSPYPHGGKKEQYDQIFNNLNLHELMQDEDLELIKKVLKKMQEAIEKLNEKI